MREIEREKERDKERERERERERDKERKSEREISMSRIAIFILKGKTGASAPFSYLVRL